MLPPDSISLIWFQPFFLICLDFFSSPNYLVTLAEKMGGLHIDVQGLSPIMKIFLFFSDLLGFLFFSFFLDFFSCDLG